METRKFSRVQFKVESTITVAGRHISGSVENLSMSGMFMETPERLEIGEPVDIRIVLSGTSPEISISFNGHVSRVTDSGLGFNFDKIDIDSYTHLKNIISYNIDDSEKVMEEIYHSIDEKLSSNR